MKCPYCGEEMEYGVIQSARALNWAPDRDFFASVDKQVILSPLSILKGSAVVAFRCAKCEKIIIDYEGNKADANANANKDKKSKVSLFFEGFMRKS